MEKVSDCIIVDGVLDVVVESRHELHGLHVQSIDGTLQLAEARNRGGRNIRERLKNRILNFLKEFRNSRCKFKKIADKMRFQDKYTIHIQQSVS